MTPATAHSPTRIALFPAFAIVYVVWGSTYLAIRFAIEALPPFLMAAARLAGAWTCWAPSYACTPGPTQ